MFLVRTIAADRATSKANADAQYVGQVIAGNRSAARRPRRAGRCVDDVERFRLLRRRHGHRRPLAAARGREPATRPPRAVRSVDRTRGGIDVFLPVLQPAGQTAVVRVSVPRREVRRGVMAAWVSLGRRSRVVLVLLAALVADRMARSITKPLNTLTDIARRLSRRRARRAFAGEGARSRSSR